MLIERMEDIMRGVALRKESVDRNQRKARCKVLAL